MVKYRELEMYAMTETMKVGGKVISRLWTGVVAFITWI